MERRATRQAYVVRLVRMAERQLVKYTFWKVPGEVLGWPDDRRTEAAAELAAGLDERAAGTLLTYSTVGMRGDCDMLVWQAADTLDLIQQAESAWRATALGARLTVAHSFLAMMRPSPYLGSHRHPDQEGLRTRLKPAGGRYLFVYPMWKKRIWYRLPYERRKAMMVEHFAIGHRYPQVKINTAYSFGLDDQEFVVAFECDEPAANPVLPALGRAARREVVDRRPVWFMRQAGRSLPEYRRIRESHDLFAICQTPDLCAEVTMQPVRRLGVDGAVLFADIMLPVAFGLGVELQLVDGVGPVIQQPIRAKPDIDRLQSRSPAEAVPFVLEAILLLRRGVVPF